MDVDLRPVLEDEGDRPGDEQPEDDQPEDDQPEDEQPRSESRPQPERTHGAPAAEAGAVVREARRQLAELLGAEAERVSGLERVDGTWKITLEVVELPRIPESTDVLASYEVELDGDRNLVRYARRRRYHRSQADDGETR